MMATTITIAIVALVLGYFIAKVLEKKKASSTLKNVEEQACLLYTSDAADECPAV